MIRLYVKDREEQTNKWGVYAAKYSEVTRDKHLIM